MSNIHEDLICIHSLKRIRVLGLNVCNKADDGYDA